MALPNVKFTNNLGSIEFQRCLLSIGDNWEWDGTNTKRSKTIGVEGHLAQADDGFEGVLTQTGSGTDRTANLGLPGTLTLPWTTLHGVKLQQITMPESTWIQMVPVQATFVDDTPGDKAYTISFFGLELHNPRIRVPMLDAPVRDTYLQMQIEQGSSGNIATLRSGAIRQRGNCGVMQVEVSGHVVVENGQLPDNLLFKLVQRLGTPGVESLVEDASYPNGYPNIFPIATAIPELKGELAFESAFVEKARVSWNVETGSAAVALTLCCPPQKLAEV